MRAGRNRSTRINLGESASTLAINRCCSCGHEWQDKTMGLARFLTCPDCDSEYWKWLSYEGDNRRGTPEAND